MLLGLKLGCVGWVKGFLAHRLRYGTMVGKKTLCPPYEGSLTGK
jgi:hypothetical protein